MRTINKYFYLLAAVALAGVVSCVKEKETFQPGEPDSETCEGVYFIKQDVIEETQIFDPTQLKRDTIVVRRSNSDGALNVTPKATLSEITSAGPVPAGVDSLFTVSEIVFEDGQEESYVALDFEKVKEGVQYSLHLSIEGDEISSKYSNSLKACDYKVMCVAYVPFLNPVTKEPAKITFTHGWWGEKRTAYIKYYEVDGVRHCVTYDEALVGTTTNGAHEEKGGFWGVDPNQHLEFLWFQADDPECSDCGDKHPYTIPAGYEPAVEGGELMTFVEYQHFQLFDGQPETYVVDYYGYQRMGGYARPYLHFVDANSLFDCACYYDLNGGFYFWVLGYNNIANRGSGWAFPQDYDIVGIAEGFARADYSIELTAGMTQQDSAGNNVVPIDFELGADVDKVGYTILEGKVSSALIDSEAAAIAKDTIDYKYATWVEAEGISFSDSVSTKATGMFTLVAVGLDTNKVAKSSASVVFKYLKAGDAGDVVLNVAAASSASLASQGWSPETSFLYTISGAGLTGAIPMFFTQAEVEAEGGIEYIISDIKSDPNAYYSLLSDDDFDGKLSDAQLAEANNKGFTDIYSSGVTPGTEYYVVVWATNGYDVAVEYDTILTAGDPLPIYQNYDYTSRVDELIDGKSVSDFFGTYNLYAIDSNGSASLRGYMGKAVIAAYDADKYGEVETDGEPAQISGLGCGIGGDDFDDTILIDFCENPFGADAPDKLGLFIAGKFTADGKSAKLYTWVPAGNNFYNWAYAIVGYPVADGYIAFVGESYYTDNYGYFPNINFYDGTIDEMFQDYLLVDPAKDDNGLAPKSVAAAIASAKKARGNKVEIAGNMRFNKLNGVNKISAKSPYTTIMGVPGLAPVESIKRVAASHKISLSVNKAEKEINMAPVQFSSRKNMK